MRPVGSRYFLEEMLGRGATGTVWRSQVRDTGDVVAIKVLKEELASDPDIVMRFLRERSVLLRLRHPHVVRVRDLVVEGDLLALVMDLVEGPDLHRYLRENGPFTPVGAALLTAAVADALAASHADGVVHRDLKPANVLLATVTAEDGSAQMHPMLTDFGIARLADSPGITRTQEFVGTPAYVAPEAAQGRPQTSAVDIYGAGILLYELATGHPPFRGESALEVLYQHLSAEPRRPSTVPEPLWTVIEHCLRKDPDQRPSAENLARALRVVAAGVGVHASPAAAEAAFGVAGLLTPDRTPAPVPATGTATGSPAFGTGAGTAAGTGAGFGEADATQVLPSHAPAFDPNGATSVMPAAGLPADGTQVMPPVPDGPPRPPEPQGPHPWQSQLSAARDRAEQTEVQYLDPDQDPLRRRPRRQPPAAPPPGQQPYGRQAQPYAEQPQRQPQTQPQTQPRRQPAPRRPPEPPPQRYEPPRRREPEPAPRAAPRERSRNRMYIPGLGCLKGCLTMIVVLVVIGLIVWNTTDAPTWWATATGWVETVKDWFDQIGTWLSALSGDSGSGNTP